MIDIGHNSGAVDKETLESYVSRIENLLADKKVIQEDIKELYLVAKNQGLNTRALRKLISERAKPVDKALEETLDMYRAALGLLSDTPLGEAAIAKAGSIA